MKIIIVYMVVTLLFFSSLIFLPDIQERFYRAWAVGKIKVKATNKRVARLMKDL